MNKKICVYTCITGDYDDLPEIENPEQEIDYYCFTNNKKLKATKVWKIIQIHNPDKLDNCRLARKIKILGTPIVNQYDIAVWTDADIVWQKPIVEFIKKYAQNSPFTIFKHHARNNIYDEAITCVRLRKDNKKNIERLLDYYKKEHYPDNNGLCESTVFIKHPNNPKVIDTMKIWFEVLKKYSRRDQLSFNYAVWKTNLEINYIPLEVWNNPWFYVKKHTSNYIIQDCHIYFGNPDKDFDFNKYQVFSYKKKDDIYYFNTTIPIDTDEIEFNPSNIIGVSFDKISITPIPNSTLFQGTISINDQKVFTCNDHGVIRAYHDFKKGQKLSFSIQMQIPTTATLNKIIEYQWALAIKQPSPRSEMARLRETNSALQAENSILKNDIKTLQSELDKLINSKGWQTLEKIRKILPH